MTLTAPVGLVCEFFMVIKFVSINVTLFSSVGKALTETAMGVQLILLLTLVDTDDDDDDDELSPPIPIPPSLLLPTSLPILPFPRRTISNDGDEVRSNVVVG